MQTVHAYIKAQESLYQAMPIPIVEGYQWNMYEHVRLTTLYLNSKYKNGTDVENSNKPFRNIILPKINLEHRSVQFDRDEIEFYINDPSQDFKAFLVKKWHDRWSNQNDVVDFLDAMTETYTDYGGVLLKDYQSDMPEVVPFQRLAFVDQTDMLSGPICEKHEFSPDQIKAMEAYGWGNPKNGATGSVNDVIALASEYKTNTQTQGGVGINAQPKARTPGRYIETYELHGMLPETFLDPDGDPNTFVRQMHIVTYYVKTNGEAEGVTLFAGKEAKSPYKAKKRDDADSSTFGRALGRGAVEELFEPQVWTNYNEIAKKEMLDQVSKILYWTNDQSFKARNTTSEMENGDTLVVADGKTFSQLNTGAPNVVAFENAAQQWDQLAQQIAATTDLMAGAQPKSNTPNELGMATMQQGQGLHEYRKKRLAGFVREVYRDWILPRCLREIAKGASWLEELSIDEMNDIVDQVVNYHFNLTVIGKVLAGEIVYPDEADSIQQMYRQQFFKTNRKFLKILEGELKDLPIDVEVNVASSGPNALMAQKLGQVWTQAVNALAANPNFFTQQPQMAKLFNQMLQAYGLSPISFGMNKLQPVAQPLIQPNQPQNGQDQPQPDQVQKSASSCRTKRSSKTAATILEALNAIEPPVFFKSKSRH